jgi:hypothetical protein
MAIKGFKEVVEKKGYRLDNKDRQIFEKEIRRGYFGFDVGDIIEFVIYDASDNQLPQESVNGHKVRYINYTDENIKAYFDKVPENKFNKKSNNAKEYFIDTEKLIKEAGYSNGVFKTQITLLNRRLGSEPRLFDKVWIHEISPSRTEVRVLPVVEDGTSIPNSDLQERYDTFVNCGIFTADVLVFFDEFVDQLDVTKVVKNMLMKKGTISEGQDYIKLIEQEFKLVNFEVYMTRVKKLFQEIIDNYRMNRYYNPFEANYGQSTGDSFGIEFDISKVAEEVCEMASNAAEYSLPKQAIRLNTFKSRSQQRTIDSVKQLLLTVRSNETYTSSRPAAMAAQIRGCTDPTARNYNPRATISSQCVYNIKTAKYKSIKVCNDREAENYNKDGNCVYAPRCQDRNASNYGAKGACVYPAPPPPPQPPPNPPPPRPRGSSTRYGISSSWVTGMPIAAGGRVLVQISVQASPGGAFIGKKFGSGSKKAFIKSKPSWVTIQYGTKPFSYTSGKCTLRVNVLENSGNARNGTIVIGSDLPGNPTTSITVSQVGKTIVIKKDPPKPKPPTQIPFSTNGPNPITMQANGAAYGPRTITVNAPAGVRWSVEESGTAVHGIQWSATSQVGPGKLSVREVFPSTSTRETTGRIRIKCGNTHRDHKIVQMAAQFGMGYGQQGSKGVQNQSAYAGATAF